MPDDALQAYKQPITPARIGLAVIVLFAGTITAWSAFAPLSDAAIAQGSLQVQGRRQSVQHPYGGVVRELNVAEGDRVSKGQELLLLSDSEPRANLDVLTVEQSTLHARYARLKAERDGLDDVAFPADVAAANRDSIASETAILKTRNRQHESSLNVLRRKIDQLNETISGAQSEATGLERQIALTEDELGSARQLLEQGYTPRPRVLGLERDVSQLRSALASKRSEVAVGRQSIAEAETELARLDRARLSEVAEELNQVQAKLAEVGPKIAAAQDVLSRTKIVAPASGTIVELSIFTEGGVVEPGAKLMEIVPSETPFFADARLRLTELHGIQPGQRAQVELLSSPRSQRPDISGEVVTVSADRIVDERSGEGYYALQVALNPEDVAAANVELQAGMPVEVIMPTRSRTLIDYLTSPLLDELNSAFREY